MKLHTNKLNNLEEIDKFLKTDNLPIINHEEMASVNTPITIIAIKSVIKSSPIKKKKKKPRTRCLHS